jgi:tRNA1(Val) A37 N6-methylase TrmN6
MDSRSHTLTPALSHLPAGKGARHSAPASEATPTPAADLTEDALLAGRVRLLQPRRGYRVAIDPVLLGAAVPAEAGETVLDAGLGSGAASLCLLARVPGCVVAGLELQPELAALAARNADLNGRPLEVIGGDLLSPPADLRRRQFDHVMTNPPFDEAGRGTPSPLAQRDRAHAHGAEAGGVAGWLDACLRRLAPRGRLTLIHRADRLDLILAALAGQLGGITVLPLWPAAGEPARRIIVSGRKGARGPSRLGPGLALHGPDGRFTPEAEAVLREAAPLAL